MAPRLTCTASETTQKADKAGVVHNVGDVAWQQHVLLQGVHVRRDAACGTHQAGLPGDREQALCLYMSAVVVTLQGGGLEPKTCQSSKRAR